MSGSGNLADLLLEICEGGPGGLLTGWCHKIYFGPDFDDLLYRKVLVEQSPAAEWSVCSGCGCGGNGRLLTEEDGRWRAVCPMDETADAILTTDDLRSFRINVDVLVRSLVPDTLLGRCDQLYEGLWHLGSLPTGRHILLALWKGPLLQPGFVSHVQAVAEGAPVSVLGPDLDLATYSRFREAGLRFAVLRQHLRPAPSGMAVLNLTGLDNDGTQYRLIVEAETMKILLDGRRLHPPHQLERLLKLLANQALQQDPVVKNNVIQGQLRREPRDIVSELRGFLDAHSLSESGGRNLIQTVRARGYMLALGPRIKILP